MSEKQTLHIVSKSPHGSQALARCLAALGEHDGILLIEDGVYGLTALMESGKQAPVSVLKPDMQARGLLSENLDGDKVELIDYQQFVSLCADYQKSVSWF